MPYFSVYFVNKYSMTRVYSYQFTDHLCWHVFMIGFAVVGHCSIKIYTLIWSNRHLALLTARNKTN